MAPGADAASERRSAGALSAGQRSVATSVIAVACHVSATGSISSHASSRPASGRAMPVQAAFGDHHRQPAAAHTIASPTGREKATRAGEMTSRPRRPHRAVPAAESLAAIAGCARRSGTGWRAVPPASLAHDGCHRSGQHAKHDEADQQLDQGEAPPGHRPHRSTASRPGRSGVAGKRARSCRELAHRCTTGEFRARGNSASVPHHRRHRARHDGRDARRRVRPPVRRRRPARVSPVPQSAR